MPHYAHMMPEDVRVWSQYLRSPVAPIAEVWYDVHVGTGIAVPEGTGDLERSLALSLGQKRIDVVARVRGGYWVVEVKPRADMTAFGQVMVYAELVVAEWALEGKVWRVIVCDDYDVDVLAECDRAGVVVITV